MMILTSGHNLQDAPYHPRIDQKRWRTGAVLMGKMTSLGGEGSTNSWGSLDWEDNHFLCPNIQL